MYYPESKNRLNIVRELEGDNEDKMTQRHLSKDSKDSFNVRRNLLSKQQKKNKETDSKSNRKTMHERKQSKQILKLPLEKVSSKSIFNNQQLKNIKTKQSRQKTNRKSAVNKQFEKLKYTIGYLISSAEKAFKFVNQSNFEAQFAVKLFKSDKENVMKEMNNMIDAVIKNEQTIKIISPIRRIKSQQSISNQHILKSELVQVKKILYQTQLQLEENKNQRIYLMNQMKSLKHQFASSQKYQKSKIKTKQKQIQVLINQINETDKIDKNKQVLYKHNVFLKQKQNEKLKRIIRWMSSNQTLQKYFQTIEKETKYGLLIFSNFENSRKRVELEQILKTLQNQRLHFEKQIDESNFSIKNKQNDILKLYIKQRLRPVLGISDETNQIQLIQKCIQKINDANTTQFSHQNIVFKFQQQLSDVQNQKQSLRNQLQFFKMSNQSNAQISPQIKQQNELLKQNINQIYEQLLIICNNNQLINETNSQISIQQTLAIISNILFNSKNKIKSDQQNIRFMQQKILKINERYEIIAIENQRLNNVIELLQFEKQDQQRIRDIQRNNSDTMNKLHELQRQKFQFQQRIKEIKHKNEQLKQQNIDKEKKLVQIQQTLLAGSYDKFLISNRYQQLKSQYDQLNLQNQKANDQLLQHLNIIDKLKEEIQLKNKHQYQQSQLQNKFVEQNTELRQTIRIKSQELQESIGIIDSLQNKLSELMISFKQIATHKQLIERQKQDIKNKYQNQINNLHNNNQITINQYSQQISQLKQSLVNIQQNKGQQNTVVANLQYQLSKANQKIQQIQNHKQQYINKIYVLSDQISQQKVKMDAILAHNQQQINELMRENHQFKEQSNNKIMELQDKIKILQEQSMNRSRQSIGSLQKIQSKQQQINEFGIQTSQINQQPINQGRNYIQQMVEQLCEKQRAFNQKSNLYQKFQTQSLVNKQKILILEKQVADLLQRLKVQQNNWQNQQNIWMNKQNNFKSKQQQYLNYQNQIINQIQQSQQAYNELQNKFILSRQSLSNFQNQTSLYLQQNKQLKQQIEQLMKNKTIQNQNNFDSQSLMRKANELQLQVQNLQIRQHEHLKTIQQLRSVAIEDSIQFVDYAVQVYIPDFVEQTIGGQVKSGSLIQLQNIVQKLNSQISIYQNRITKYIQHIQQRDLIITRLSESKRLAQNQIRIFQMNIQYLNQRIDQLTNDQQHKQKYEQHESVINIPTNSIQNQGGNQYIENNNTQNQPILLQTQIRKLYQQIQTQKQNISVLQKQLSESHNKYSEYKTQKQKQYFQCINQIQSYERIIHKLKQMINSQQNNEQLNKLKQQLVSTQQEYKILIEQKNMIIMKCQKQIIGYQTTIQQLQESLSNSEKSNQNQNNSMIKQLNNQLQQSNKRFCDYQNNSEIKMNQYQSQIENYKRQLGQEPVFKENQGQLSKLKISLQEANRAFYQYRKQKQIQLNKYQQMIESYSNIIQDLKVKNKQQQLPQIIKGIYIQSQKLKSLLDPMQKQLIIKNKKIQLLEMQLKQLSQKMQQMKNNKQQQSNSVKELRLVIIVNQQTISKQKQQLIFMNDLQQKNNKTIQELYQIKQQYQNYLNNFKQENQKIVRQSTYVKSQNERVSKNNEQLLFKVKQTQIQIQRLSSQYIDTKINDEIKNQLEIKIQEMQQKQNIILKQIQYLKFKQIEKDQVYKSAEQHNRRLFEELEYKNIKLIQTQEQLSNTLKYLEQIQSSYAMKKMELESYTYLIKKIIKLGLGFQDLEGLELERMVEISLERVKQRRQNKSLEYSHSMEQLISSVRKDSKDLNQEKKAIFDQTYQIKEEQLEIQFDSSSNYQTKFVTSQKQVSQERHKPTTYIYQYNNDVNQQYHHNQSVEYNQKDLNDFSDFKDNSIPDSSANRNQSFVLNQNQEQLEQKQELSGYFNPYDSSVKIPRTQNSQHVFTPFQTKPSKQLSIKIIQQQIISTPSPLIIQPVSISQSYSKQQFIPSTSEIIESTSQNEVNKSNQDNINPIQTTIQKIQQDFCEATPFPIVFNNQTFFESKQINKQFNSEKIYQTKYQPQIQQNGFIQHKYQQQLPLDLSSKQFLLLNTKNNQQQYRYQYHFIQQPPRSYFTAESQWVQIQKQQSQHNI